MAFPTAENDQITDAVTQSNVEVVGDATALAMGAMFQTMAHSTGLLFENATSVQQQSSISAQASTNQGVIQVYTVDTMAGALSTVKVAQCANPQKPLAQLAVLKGLKS
jgi:hypothetical protein